MKIKVTSRGETEFKLDPQYEEPAVREVLGRADSDIASEVTEYTDIERSNISHDEYAVVTEDDGTELWRGWLHGIEGPAPDETSRRLDKLRGQIEAVRALAEQHAAPRGSDVMSPRAILARAVLDQLGSA